MSKVCPCRHCKQGKWIRSRGLCYDCWFNPAIRELYPSMQGLGGGSAAVGNHGRRLPDQPTRAQPGSPEKIEILEARAAADVALFHPDDLRLEWNPVACEMMG